MNEFEIRLELLKLAQGIESERIWAERNRLEQDWNAKREHFSSAGSEPLPFPKLPGATYSDIIQVAEQLNKFVSNKG